MTESNVTFARRESAPPEVPDIPSPRGVLSNTVGNALRQRPSAEIELPGLRDVDPYGADLHVALHMCYELHYRGYLGVAPEWEWSPQLLSARALLEEHFLGALGRDVHGGNAIDAEMDALLLPAEGGVSTFLREDGTWRQLMEYFVHRSMYHHKEADPYIWAVPRLSGQAKAAFVAVEFDEFGGGHGDRVHARLYADLLRAAGLNCEYLHYFDVVPAPMLAIVNMMSLFGLHRTLRGALVGHFATVEITSSPASADLLAALENFGAAEACKHFYAEHVEADAVHEQVLRNDVIGDLLEREPELTPSVVFGIQVTNLLERHFSEHVLGQWNAGRSSLREVPRTAV